MPDNTLQPRAASAQPIADSAIEAGAQAINRAMLDWKAANGGDNASCIDCPEEVLAKACIDAALTAIRAGDA